jgi:glucose/arabinose dehydrogenase/PKD repeat protein
VCFGRGLFLCAFAVLLTGWAWTATAPAATVPSGFEDRPLVTGLTYPVAVTWAPDGRMFVAEHAGTIRVVTAAGQLLDEPLLDIADHTNLIIDQGILGLAADSDFENNHYLWILYVHESNPSQPYAQKTARLVRVEVEPDNTLVNPSDPETVVLGKVSTPPCPAPSNSSDCIPSTWTHTIGTVRSGPDGTLWIGAGDAGTPFLATDEQSYSGKILHVDRDGQGLPDHPFCPDDTDLTHVCTKVYAKGLRNPFRFTLRPGGGLVVGDVGDEARDELDFVTAGKSYGWPCYEGGIRSPRYSTDSRCTGPGGEYAKEGTEAAAVGPVFDYPVPPEGAAIVGGPTYAGDAFPEEYRGHVFFGDYVKNLVRQGEVDSEGNLVAVTTFGTGWPGVDLEEAPWGDLVYADLLGGQIRAISYVPDNRSPVAEVEATPTFGDLPLEVQFSSEGTGDPDGDELLYEWSFGDGSTSSEPNPTHSYDADGKYTAELTVGDGHGRSATAAVVISAGNSPPTATIDAPADGSTFDDGQTVELLGSATDPRDGDLGDEDLSWTVLLHHASHVHPFGPFEGSAASFLATDDHDSDSYYEVRLTATNSRGLSDTATVTVRPRTSALTLDGIPSGAPVTYSGTSFPTPVTRDAAVGFHTQVSVPERYLTENGKIHDFLLWTDGGSRSHDIVIGPAPRRIVAVYGEDKAGDRLATASTFHTGVEPWRAVDGVTDSMWHSAAIDASVWPQWWQVDLGSSRTINSVWIDWAAEFASRYRVDVSTDGTNFTTVATVTTSQPGLKGGSFGTRTARYVRVTGLQNATPGGIGFRNVQIFGPGDSAATEDKAAGRPSTAFTSRAENQPGRAVDGSSSTRWLSLTYGAMWWQVDLGRMRSVDRVALNWDESAWPTKYEISTSPDGTNFSLAREVTIGKPGWTVDPFAARRARYLRVTATKPATFNGVGLWDARVFGPAD